MYKKIKINLRSQKGFTLQDIAIECIIFTTFVGLISTLMYNVYLTNTKANLSAQMAIYATQILEDIDKISYEEAQEMTSELYKQKFNIPNNYGIDLELTDYTQENENIQDIIKIVNLNISYKIFGDTETFSVKRLKIKEY